MAKKKKTDLTNMKQTHGAVLTPQKSILDFNGLNKSRYTAVDAVAYTKELATMSLADLQYHAINVAQIRPGFDRNRLIASLERRFSEHLFQQKLRSL